VPIPDGETSELPARYLTLKPQIGNRHKVR
jgi:hypothetical protein